MMLHRLVIPVAAWVCLPLSLVLGEDARRIALVTAAPTSGFAQSVSALCPGRVTVLDPRAAGDGVAAKDFSFLLCDIPQQAEGDERLGRSFQQFAESGGTVIVGLEEFARWRGMTVKVETLPNQNHIPNLQPDQWKSLHVAAAKICGNAPNSQPPRWTSPAGNLPEAWMNDVCTALRAEVLEPIPRITVVQEDPLLAGFAIGDSIPWCGNREGRYEQHQLETPSGGERPKLDVLAISSLNKLPVFVRQTLGKGVVYALDFHSLDEPHVTWETRGSFNKYLFLGNLLGRSLRYGRHWNSKPLAEEWPTILRELAAKHPAWRVEVDGHVNGYNVYSLNLGEPSKPIWCAIGMYHADDEWRSALGLLDFARYIAQHREYPEIQRQLEKFCLKLIPCQHPAMYMKVKRGFAPGPEVRQPPEPQRHAQPANLAMAFTIHECDADLQYGIIPQTAASLPLVRRIEDLHRARIANRFVQWQGAAPLQAEAKCWKDRMTDALAEEFRYYGFPIAFDHLDNIGKPSFEKLPFQICIEGGRRGLWPEPFLQHYQLRALIWEEDMYRSATMNELIADWTLAGFLSTP